MGLAQWSRTSASSKCFNFLKAGYTCALVLQLNTIIKKAKAAIAMSTSWRGHWLSPESLRLTGFLLQFCNFSPWIWSKMDGSSAKLPLPFGFGLGSNSNLSPRVGGPSLSHRPFTFFIPSLISVFDPPVLLQEGSIVKAYRGLSFQTFSFQRTFTRE